MNPSTSPPGTSTGGKRRPTSVELAPRDASSDAGAIVHPLELRRLAAGFLTPVAFAEAAGMNRNTISEIEAHDGRKVRGANLDKMAKALDVEITVLAREFRNPAGGLLEPQKRIVSAGGKPRR